MIVASAQRHAAPFFPADRCRPPVARAGAKDVEGSRAARAVLAPHFTLSLAAEARDDDRRLTLEVSLPRPQPQLQREDDHEERPRMRCF
jgi:hypothetical protein